VTDPAGDAVAVSVVFATRDRPDMARAAVQSARAALRPSDELIVVDSASADPDAVRSACGDVTTFIRLERPGLSRARNAGWRAASRPIVAFTDDDCSVPSDWTAKFSAAMGEPAIGFATGSVVGDRDAALQSATMVDASPRRIEGAQDPVRFGSGANMAFRRATLEEINGFDEALGSGTRLRSAEDHDAFWRALRAGWVGVYDPTIVVTHRLWRSRMKSLGRQFGYGVGAGALAMKVIRSGDRDGWRFLRKRVWSEGPAAAVKSLGKGHESAAAAQAAGALGAAVGAVRVAVFRIEGGMLRRRRS
jgi:glycosyltransferase involved in cell wall biosynthesis